MLRLLRPNSVANGVFQQLRWTSNKRRGQTNAWELYVMGCNPEYPPRWKTAKELIEHDIDVFQCSIYELDDAGMWFGQREFVESFDPATNPRGWKKEQFPRFPFDVKYKDRLKEYSSKYPLTAERKAEFLKKLEDARVYYELDLSAPVYRNLKK